MTFEPDAAPPPRLAQPWWRRALGWRPRLSLAGFARGLAKLGWGRVALALVAIVVIYYVGGGLWLHRIDDRSDFAPQAVQAGESHAVAMAVALITREVDDHHWTPMDPFFLPGAWLDNMPNYQSGIMKALARFTVEMRDQLARSRGSSPQDADLDTAASRLNTDPRQWVYTPSVSVWLPSVTATQQYRSGRAALIAYNKRLATGQATFERRADNLQAFLERVATDIGSTSAQIDRHIHDHGGDLLDFHADNLFYANKGQLYAYYMLLKELGFDYQNVLKERDLAGPWQQMLETFRTASTLQPWVVINGAPDSQFLPSHLVSQGFYLLRARTQLREVADILRK